MLCLRAVRHTHTIAPLKLARTSTVGVNHRRSKSADSSSDVGSLAELCDKLAAPTSLTSRLTKKAVSERLNSLATSCSQAESAGQQGSWSTAAGLPAKGRSVKASICKCHHQQEEFVSNWCIPHSDKCPQTHGLFAPV